MEILGQNEAQGDGSRTEILGCLRSPIHRGAAEIFHFRSTNASDKVISTELNDA